MTNMCYTEFENKYNFHFFSLFIREYGHVNTIYIDIHPTNPQFHSYTVIKQIINDEILWSLENDKDISQEAKNYMNKIVRLKAFL